MDVGGGAHSIRQISRERLPVEAHLGHVDGKVLHVLVRSENAVKNKFYGKVRKLVRKLNNICRERINRSNKPLRDESIMRIIDINEGFENLPERLV